MSDSHLADLPAASDYQENPVSNEPVDNEETPHPTEAEEIPQTPYLNDSNNTNNQTPDSNTQPDEEPSSVVPHETVDKDPSVEVTNETVNEEAASGHAQESGPEQNEQNQPSDEQMTDQTPVDIANQSRPTEDQTPIATVVTSTFVTSMSPKAITFADALSSKVVSDSSNGPIKSSKTTETKTSAAKTTRTARSIARTALFSSDGTNIVNEVELIETICDVKRCEFKDKSLEGEFQKYLIPTAVRRHSIIMSTYLVLEILFDVIFLGGLNIVEFLKLPHSATVLVLLLSGFASVRFQGHPFANKVMHLMYHLTPMIMLIVFSWRMIFSALTNVGYAGKIGAFLATYPSRTARIVQQQLARDIILFTFIAVQGFQYKITVNVASYLLLIVAMVIIPFGVNAEVASSKAVLLSQATFVFVVFKTILVSSIAKYRSMISRRLVYYQTRNDQVPLKHEKMNFFRRVYRAIFTDPKFNVHHDERQRQNLHSAVRLILIVDTMLSIFGLTSTRSELMVPVVTKCALLFALMIVFEMVWRKTEESTAIVNKNLVLNIVCVAFVVADNLLFLMDSVWTLSLLTPTPEAIFKSAGHRFGDEVDIAITKSAAFWGTYFVNIIGLTVSGMRLPWSILANSIPAVVFLCLSPIIGQIAASNLSAPRIAYMMDGAWFPLVRVVATAVIASMEAHIILKVHKIAYDTVATRPQAVPEASNV